MKSVLLQLLAVANSAVLALPPGWCGAFMRHDRVQPAPVQATCCHRAAQGHPSKSEQVPSRPTVECCCQRDATVPEKPVHLPDAPPLALPLVADIPAMLVGQPHGETAGVFVSPGPPLHVLQCVWRC
jgi:hypothetical protein